LSWRYESFVSSVHLTYVSSLEVVDAWMCCVVDSLCNCVSRLQGTRIGSDAWLVSFEIAGGSSAGKLHLAAVERRAPSAGKLSVIWNLRDQLRCTQQELRRVTALVDVARSKASRAADAERYLLGEIDSLGKAMKCKYSLFMMDSFGLPLLISSSALLGNTDACLDDKAEARQANAYLSAAQTHANLVSDNFWANRFKAEASTVLQDRIS
jgi:hypothetical protein